MKWKNKGRELELLAREWDLSNPYYIWGTSNSADYLVRCFCDELRIISFVDGNRNKQGGYYKEKEIVGLDAIHKDHKIVIASEAYSEISIELSKKGFKEKKDYIDYSVFIGLNKYYREDKVFLSRTDLSLTSRCNLKCENCNMFMPYFREAKDKSIEEIKRDLDLYFTWVDQVRNFYLLGGEPFLYKDLYDVLDYMENHYLNKADRLWLFSNGTVLPKKEIIEKIIKMRVKIEIGDYHINNPKLKPKVEQFVELLEKNNIPYNRKTDASWLDFGVGSFRHSFNEGELIRYFDRCYPPFRALHNGKFYYCHINAGAVNAGLYEHDETDCFDLSGYDKDRRVELVEYNMGYNQKGYLSLCRNCRGCGPQNTIEIPVAIQMQS